MSRIYIVHDTRANPSAQRLVRAANRAQALRHVAQGAFVVDIASQNALVHLLSNGVQVEDAREASVLQAAADAAESVPSRREYVDRVIDEPGPLPPLPDSAHPAGAVPLECHDDKAA